MSLLRDNIRPRLQLMRTALSRRFVYADVVAMAKAYGLDYRDLCADTEPFGFVQSLVAGATATPPDFAALIEPAEKFTPPGASPLFNSEPSVGRFLGRLVFFSKARTVVELGCFAGWASAHMALALKAAGLGGRIHCVDYVQEYLDVMLANLGRHGLGSLVTPVRGLSLEPAVLAALPSEIDVIFLDTSHAYPDTRDEILAYAPRLSAGGVLVLHDSVSASGVRRSVQEVAKRFNVLTFATEQSNGVTVLQSR
jgi:predicted O-methyltransferase YrrM